jgi:hypothetical protein
MGGELPQGLSYVEDFVSEDEERSLLLASADRELAPWVRAGGSSASS